MGGRVSGWVWQRCKHTKQLGGAKLRELRRRRLAGNSLTAFRRPGREADMQR